MFLTPIASQIDESFEGTWILQCRMRKELDVDQTRSSRHEHPAPLRSPAPPPSASGGLQIQVRTQLRTTSTQFVIRGTGKLATRGRTARERLSLGRTCTAL